MEQAMTRENAIARLCDWYTGYFDVTRHETPQAYLEAECDFHVHSDKYVLTKKAKLWEANSHEYVFLFSVPHLTQAIYEACEKLAYERGMEKIEPGPTHMYSYISAIIVCDTCDEAARRALKKCRIYKSFRLSYWGWMDFHTGLVELNTQKAVANRSGKSAAQMLETTLFHKQAKKFFKRREKIL
ncbi:MAG: hypothetical protein GXW99_01160 [Clostridiales bacterium]|nr:hypothetical protein [Clostridiales bacterium]